MSRYVSESMSLYLEVLEFVRQYHAAKYGFGVVGDKRVPVVVDGVEKLQCVVKDGLRGREWCIRKDGLLYPVVLKDGVLVAQV